jgi:cell division protein FtsN
MGNNRGGSRMDTMIKLVLIFFISLLSFSVGTYVGKQVTDADHRKAEVEGDYQDVAGSMDEGMGHSTDKAEGGEKLSDDEIASLTEEFVKKESTEVAPAAKEEAPAREVASTAEAESGYKKFKGANAKPAAKEAPATVTEPIDPTAEKPQAEHKKESGAPSQEAQRVSEGKAPAEDAKAPRKPISELPTVAGSAIGKYTVQVASYATEGEAKTFAAGLKAKGWNAFYLPAEIAGKTWFRVSVGLFTTSNSAKEFRSEFMKESKLSSALVQKIVK